MQQIDCRQMDDKKNEQSLEIPYVYMYIPMLSNTLRKEDDEGTPTCEIRKSSSKQRVCVGAIIHSFLFIQYYVFPFLKMVTRTKKIFVGGLSANTTVEDVKKYFEQYGKVNKNF